MQWIAVDWEHSDAGEPVHLYYELDADGFEHRKVEEYRDGTLHAAAAGRGQGSTFLAWEPHPPLARINADPRFRARELTAQGFEDTWDRATRWQLAPALG